VEVQICNKIKEKAGGLIQKKNSLIIPGMIKVARG
jgi:hypothetical protein